MNLSHFTNKILKDPILYKLSNLAKAKEIPLFLVGGYVRDLLLDLRRHASASQEGLCTDGRPQSARPARKDYDLTMPKEASSFIPAIEEALRFRFFKVGKDELNTAAYRIIKEEISIDLTLFHGPTIEEDLRRRDFTVNAIAFSLLNETYYRVEGALEDLEKKVIRTVSKRAIDQDPLRMLRAIRYLCTLEDFSIDGSLKEEITLKKDLVRKLPGERVKMELDQIFLSPRPAIGVNFLFESNLLFTLIPELKGLQDLAQGEYHHLDAISHICLMIEKVPWAFEWIVRKGKKVILTQEDWTSLYYAALFHDLGKQNTLSKDEKGRIHFFFHEDFSCQRSEGVMERLRFSNPTRNKVLRLIRNHMRILNLSQEAKETALKRLVNWMEDETPLLVLHTLADKESSRGILSVQVDEIIEAHCLRIMELFMEKEIVHPPPVITGHDVMALGYAAGPKVGQIINVVRQKQIEGEIRNREEALKFLRENFGII